MTKAREAGGVMRGWRGQGRIQFVAPVAVLFLLTFSASGGENAGRIAGDQYLYAARNAEAEDLTRENQFEDWAALSLAYGDFEANMVYEAHLPPPDWSSDTSGHGLYERWVTWRHRGLSLTAGTLYALLGRGLTLKSLRNRDLRYNSNIDGMQVQFTNRYIDITAFSGKPRDFAGSRLRPIQGAEFRLTPVRFGYAGITGVQSAFLESGHLSRWGSGYFQLHGDRGAVYFEFAAKDFGSVPEGTLSKNPLGSGGTAWYSTAHSFIGNVTLQIEAAQYDSFDFSDVRTVQSKNTLAMLNTPPPALKEHAFSLMNRAQPVIDANNHTALHGEATWAISDENNISLNASRAMTRREPWSRRSEPFLRCFDFFGDSTDARGIVYPAADYSDIFLKGEMVLPGNIDWVAGTGYQQSVDARNVNFVAGGDWGIVDNHSLQGGFEHQWSMIHYSRRTFYHQLYSLSVARASAPRVSLSLFGEFSVEPVSQTSDRIDRWLGAQINWTIRSRHDLTVFAGKRKKGKICAGGVCVNKPEFSGVELVLISKW
ncbi:MAG: hypothetical protein JXA71_08770 [Chitinispirillaceae bacterium]|nr:hypothetical protein [Chitinispirillaceae bacterium]